MTPQIRNDEELIAELHKRDDPVLWALWRECEALKLRVTGLENTVYPEIERRNPGLT